MREKPGGYIILHKSISGHRAFRKGPKDEEGAFTWMLLRAEFEAREVQVAPRKKVMLQRGQLADTSRYLAMAWSWKEPRVRRFLKRLEIDGMLTRHPTHITICNYDKFQPQRRRSDAEATQVRREEERTNESMKSPPPLVQGGVSKLSDEAFRISEQIAIIAGQDPQFLTPKWMSAGPVFIVQGWLDQGMHPELMLASARGLIKLRKIKPADIRYFGPTIIEAHQRVKQMPLPLGVQLVAEGTPHEAADNRPANSWQASRDRWRAAGAKLQAAADAIERARGDGADDREQASEAASGHGRS